ncbi:hypothetical protein AMS68_002801 [Peltaster fructicola]|uniref:Uncharacterized protein n=1 Tax=Peltaster fructicola TaxID=286661 RepID=A0A6H0XRC6_9PEZI|nr:hypothetical protein AMS68_002801 [Peltaster fructicola]
MASPSLSLVLIAIILSGVLAQTIGRASPARQSIPTSSSSWQPTASITYTPPKSQRLGNLTPEAPKVLQPVSSAEVATLAPTLIASSSTTIEQQTLSPESSPSPTFRSKTAIWQFLQTKPPEALFSAESADPAVLVSISTTLTSTVGPTIEQQILSTGPVPQSTSEAGRVLGASTTTSAAQQSSTDDARPQHGPQPGALPVTSSPDGAALSTTTTDTVSSPATTTTRHKGFANGWVIYRPQHLSAVSAPDEAEAPSSVTDLHGLAFQAQSSVATSNSVVIALHDSLPTSTVAHNKEPASITAAYSVATQPSPLPGVLLPDSQASKPGLQVLTLQGQPVTVEAGRVILQSQTIPLGSALVLGSGTQTTVLAMKTKSMGGLEVVVGSATAFISALPAAQTTVTTAQSAVLTTYGQTISQIGSQFVIGSKTLAIGASITIGTSSLATVALVTDKEGKTELIVNGVTATLPRKQTASETLSLTTVTRENGAVFTSSILVPVGDESVVTSSLLGPTDISLRPLYTTDRQGRSQLVAQRTTDSLSSSTGIGGYVIYGIGPRSTTSSVVDASATVSTTKGVMAASPAPVLGEAATRASLWPLQAGAGLLTLLIVYL